MLGGAMLADRPRLPRSPWPARTLSRLLALGCLFRPTTPAFIDFDNCLPESIIKSSPRQLQFTPYFVDARFNTSDPTHDLNLTIYGNVSGQSTQGTYPPLDDPSWLDPNSTFGKIVDVSPNGGNYTTLLQKYGFLTYNAYTAPASEFCNSVVNRSCPLAPSFTGSDADPASLSAFTVAHRFDRAYSFASIAASLTVKSGSAGAPVIACISANITPALGKNVVGLLTWLPAAILLCVAIATAAAAIYSPWGSSDPFKWTTNYGRDEDLLRLVTPGFADCLHYIQFIFLTGALTLDYPGYYQPATSQVSWSALLFDESFASRGNGFQALRDGIYSTSGKYGLTHMRQLIGMGQDQDLWACMAIWLVVLGAIAVLLCQTAFLLKWAYRKISNTLEEDLRRKNWPLSIGMVLRIMLNYFLLPIVALSFFQFDIAGESHAVVIAFAVILLLMVATAAGRILWVVFTTKPRAQLFDDLRSVLMYGSLYNTYSDERAPFALVAALLTFIRGVAIGAVQPSGIAQLVILAICEVVFLLMLHAFRPFHSKTSMNVVHTVFAAVRLTTILLLVAFVPSLGVTAGPIGWIGYLILILHGFVLFIFFANAVSTAFEVGARFAGAGADAQHGVHRGGLVTYGWRQLRNRRPGKDQRHESMTSDAAMLAIDTDAKSAQLLGGRSRSQSATSQMLLSSSSPRQASELEGLSQHVSMSDCPETPIGTSPKMSTQELRKDTRISIGGRVERPALGLRTEQPVSDPYFRAPRGRRNTLDPYTPVSRSNISGVSDGWGKVAGGSPASATKIEQDDDASPVRESRQRSSSNTDYAVREVDNFYGQRGPALSDQPTRKRRTGPVDPMGAASAAATLFNRLRGGIGKGKSKDEAKGFEVVRSSRAPPPLGRGDGEEQELQTSPVIKFPPHNRDVRTDQGVADSNKSSQEHRLGHKVTAGTMGDSPYDSTWADESDDEAVAENDNNGESHARTTRRSASPPILLPIDTSGFGVPFLQRKSSQRRAESSDTQQGDEWQTEAQQPAVPRRSSRRKPSEDIGPISTSGRPDSLAVHSEQQPRPTSLGLVSQRTIRDSIVQGAGREQPQGSSAEIVLDRPL